MYEIGIRSQFEAAHQLSGDFGPATRLHGHTYTVRVLVRGARLQPDGTLYDLGALTSIVNQIVAALHYRNLDEIDGLRGRNTTAEHVAAWLWEQIAPALRGNDLDSLRVELYESPDAWAARDEQLSLHNDH